MKSISLPPPENPQCSSKNSRQRTLSQLTHEISRCYIHQPWWCNSQAVVQNSRWLRRCHRSSPHWCWSAPWETWRWSPQGPAPAHRHSVGCRGRSPVMSEKGREGWERPTCDMFFQVPPGQMCVLLSQCLRPDVDIYRHPLGLQALSRFRFRSESISSLFRVLWVCAWCYWMVTDFPSGMSLLPFRIQIWFSEIHLSKSP